MKKILLLLLVLVLNCCILASPVSAKGDNAKGAVKVDLVEAIMISESPPIYLPVLDNVVGSVILRTTGNGKLIVIVNMDNAPNLSDYDVVVFWWNSLSYALGINTPPVPLYHHWLSDVSTDLGEIQFGHDGNTGNNL